MTSLVTPYDVVPYSNHPYFQTHPDMLATVARLRGLKAPAPSQARVLELGCGAGGNLVGLAYAFPGVRAVGVDLAPSAIAEARELAATVGVGNAEFLQGDVTELADGHLGEFDYVIAHGLYAWVPEPVREGIMATIAASLAPTGLAYVSYNAEPTGHHRRVLRETAQWNAERAGLEEEAALAEGTRRLFTTLLDERFGAPREDWYARLLRQELRGLHDALDPELVHDLLGEFWRPVWFHEFAAHAAQHDLAYVGQARFGDLRGLDLPAGLSEVLDEISGGDRVLREQYIDILICRAFRETILCRSGREALTELDVTAVADLVWRPGNAEPGEDTPPNVLAVLDELAAHRPKAIAFAQLREATGADAGQLAHEMLDAFRLALISPHTDLPDAQRPGPRPLASALARYTAERSDRVTTLYNGVVFLEAEEARLLISLMDGTRDRDELYAAFRERTGLDVPDETMDQQVESLGGIPLFHS